MFNRYVTPSIKNYKRNTRSDGESNSPYVISSQQKRRPNDFMRALCNDYFKTALLSYLVESWNDDALANILESKIIFVTCEEKCYSYTNENDRVVTREEANMVNFSEEAGTRMLYHIASMSSSGNVVLRTYETDVSSASP